MQKFNHSLNSQVSYLTCESQKVTKLQVYSMKMVDHLINDLMDLAKMDNEQFKIFKNYFNLVGTLHGSLEILKDNSNLKDIKLKVSIDRKQNLALLEKIKGDENRLQ